MATLTPEEQIALVKRIAADIAMFEPGDSGYQVFTPDDIRALLDMLVAAEWQRDRAEFQKEHRVCGHGQLYWCESCSFRSGRFEEAQGVAYMLSREAPDPRHTWTTDQWRAAVRARYGMED